MLVIRGPFNYSLSTQLRPYVVTPDERAHPCGSALRSQPEGQPVLPQRDCNSETDNTRSGGP